jgi:hypothetical protein
MRGITGALRCCWGIGRKDGIAELGTGAVTSSQGQTGKHPGQGGASQDASNAPQGLAP